MSEQVNKEQMMKMFVPAVAIAFMILLAGVLVYYRNNEDTTAAGGGKPIPGAAPKPAPTGDAEGMTLNRPPADAPEWQDAGDGLKTWDVKVGDGLPATEGATVTIHYTGWTLDGNIFDGTVSKKNPPTTFDLGGLIPGWQKGIPGMKPGGIRRLYIPWKMAYGAGGNGRSIPPKADLIFEIKLFESK